MPPWLQTFFQWVHAEPARPLGLGLLAIIGVLWGLRRLYMGLERRIGARIEARQTALVQEQVNITNQEIRTATRDIIQSARDNRIPIQVVAGSEEEAEGLREILARGTETDPYPPETLLPRPRLRSRRAPVPQDRESVPTAWARILTDDEDVKEAPCPMNETPEPPPKKARAKAKRTR